MLKILTHRERITLYITVGVVIFTIGFNFLIAPILNKNESLNKEINVTRIRLKKCLLLLSQKEYIQNKYSKFSTTFKVSTQQKDSLVSVLSELENLAKNADLRILEIRPETSKGISAYKEILIDLRTEGMMEGYLNFIYHLENSLSLLRIKRFQLKAKHSSPALEGSFAISQISTLE